MERLSNIFVKIVTAKSETIILIIKNNTVIRTAVTSSNALNASTKSCEVEGVILNSHGRRTPAKWDNRQKDNPLTSISRSLSFKGKITRIDAFPFSLLFLSRLFPYHASKNASNTSYSSVTTASCSGINVNLLELVRRFKSLKSH